MESDILKFSSTDTTQFKSIRNLLEVDHHDIKVETIAYGCRITCNPCNDQARIQAVAKVARATVRFFPPWNILH